MTTAEMSIQEIEKNLEKKRNELTRLKKRREKIQKQIEDTDEAIQVATQGKKESQKKERKEPGRPSFSDSKLGSMRLAMVEILSQEGPLSAAELRLRLHKKGFSFQSLKNSVRSYLSHYKEFKRVGRGVYTLNKA